MGQKLYPGFLAKTLFGQQRNLRIPTPHSSTFVRITAALLGLLVLVQGCDEEENGDAETASGSAQASRADLLQGQTIADRDATSALLAGGGGEIQTRGNGDLSMLGGNANENQQAFRQRFGLPTQARTCLRTGNNTTRASQNTRIKMLIDRFPRQHPAIGLYPRGTAIRLRSQGRPLP